MALAVFIVPSSNIPGVLPNKDWLALLALLTLSFSFLAANSAKSSLPDARALCLANECSILPFPLTPLSPVSIAILSASLNGVCSLPNIAILSNFFPAGSSVNLAPMKSATVDAIAILAALNSCGALYGSFSY